MAFGYLGTSVRATTGEACYFTTDRSQAATIYVVTAGGGQFARMRKVAILNFCTQFIQSKTAFGASKGASMTFTRQSDGDIELDLARMTQVADALYDDVEAGLRAAGLEVVPYETPAAAPAFQKYSRNFVTGPQTVDVGGKWARDTSIDGIAIATSAEGRPFSTDCRVQNPAQTGDRVQLAHQLKDVYLLSVNTVVDFAKAKGGLLSGARADLEYGEYIVPGDTQYHFTGLPQPLYLNIWLKQAIVPARSPFVVGGAEQTGVDRERTETLGGSVHTTTVSSESEVAFDADLYYSNASSHLKALNEMFMAVLKSR